MSSEAPARPWWQGAVVYQIYPRSFCDSNGSGAGDLRGIESRLDYIASLGVDAIWMSPIFRSPQVDFGYDVSDYCDIDPPYGTLGDFDRLLKKAHGLGLKVMLDLVPSHTSDQHPWFIESLQSRDNPKADWYVWRDPKPDGTPPNNWLSVFGGPAWSYHPLRRQYYLHIFYKQQPKLNLAHPDAAEAMFASVRFWLDRGVDGFRIDVINSCLIDPALTDNPPVPLDRRSAYHWSHAPNLQEHVNDFDYPGNVVFCEAMRKVFDAYPDRFVLGEVARGPASLATYVGPAKLHSGYHFGFLETGRLKPKTFTDVYAELGKAGDAWPCVSFSNHDFVRPVTRFGSGEPERADPDLAKLLLTLVLMLRGTSLLYQGEELGLPEARVPLAKAQDPMARLYPHSPVARLREGCRTPMPWLSGRPHAGFSPVEPWLPVPVIHNRLAVDAQERDPASVLSFTRDLLRERRSLRSALAGPIRFHAAQGEVLLFERGEGADRLFCAFNLGADPAEVTVPSLGSRLAVLPGTVQLQGTRLSLGARSAYIARAT